MKTSSWMVKWSIKLSEYNLEFQPRQSIKAQALANFVAKCSFYDFQNQEQMRQSATENDSHQVVVKVEFDIQSIYIDGSSAQEGVEICILLIRSSKEEFKYSIKFMFSITNNMMEYKALLAGLQLAR